MKRPMKRVYIAGPIAAGGVVENMKRILRAFGLVMRAGDAPYIHPAMTIALAAEEYDPPLAECERWVAVGNEWMGQCDLLVRLPGRSDGADREVEHAKQRGIEVVNWANSEYAKGEVTK